MFSQRPVWGRIANGQTIYSIISLMGAVCLLIKSMCLRKFLHCSNISTLLLVRIGEDMTIKLVCRKGQKWFSSKFLCKFFGWKPSRPRIAFRQGIRADIGHNDPHINLLRQKEVLLDYHECWNCPFNQKSCHEAWGIPKNLYFCFYDLYFMNVPKVALLLRCSDEPIFFRNLIVKFHGWHW